jgi:ABC-type uncharacterized transport system permease subunit
MENIKHAGDISFIAIAIATVAGWLPAIAALVSIIYGSIRIYETKTVQGWIKRWK